LARTFTAASSTVRVIRREHPGRALAVHRAPRAPLPARGEPEPGAVLVVRAVEAVDPAVAERVLDGLVASTVLGPAWST
jgi:hypothetical protein